MAPNLSLTGLWFCPPLPGGASALLFPVVGSVRAAALGFFSTRAYRLTAFDPLSLRFPLLLSQRQSQVKVKGPFS